MSYPALDFTPPAGEEYRHQLGNDVPVYIVPSHEFPLVNISFTFKGGAYLAPADQTGITGNKAFTGDITAANFVTAGTVDGVDVGTLKSDHDALETRLATLEATMAALVPTKAPTSVDQQTKAPTKAPTAAPVAYDPADEFTKLLLHMDGADNSNTFTDDSGEGHVVSASSGAVVDAGQGIADTGAAYFDGTGARLLIQGHDDFRFPSTEEGTVEFWFKVDSDTPYHVCPNCAAEPMAIVSSTIHGSNDRGYVFGAFKNDDQTLWAQAYYNVNMYGETFVTLNEWHHYCFVRSGGPTTFSSHYLFLARPEILQSTCSE